MEAKFFSEIEKNMDINTLKEFEKEVRSKIIDGLKILRNKKVGSERMTCWSVCALKI